MWLFLFYIHWCEVPQNLLRGHTECRVWVGFFKILFSCSWLEQWVVRLPISYNGIKTFRKGLILTKEGEGFANEKLMIATAESRAQAASGSILLFVFPPFPFGLAAYSETRTLCSFGNVTLGHMEGPDATNIRERKMVSVPFQAVLVFQLTAAFLLHVD